MSYLPTFLWRLEPAGSISLKANVTHCLDGSWHNVLSGSSDNLDALQAMYYILLIEFNS